MENPNSMVYSSSRASLKTDYYKWFQEKGYVKKLLVWFYNNKQHYISGGLVKEELVIQIKEIITQELPNEVSVNSIISIEECSDDIANRYYHTIEHFRNIRLRQDVHPTAREGEIAKATKLYKTHLTGYFPENYCNVEYALSHVQTHVPTSCILRTLRKNYVHNCWMDVLCQSSFDPIKCRQQYDNKAVIVYDQLIYEAQNEHEVQVAIILSEWLERGWIIQEYLTAKKLIILTRRAIIEYNQLSVESDNDGYGCATYVVKNCSSILLLVGPFSLMQGAVMAGNVAALLASKWTYPEDINKALAILTRGKFNSITELFTTDQFLVQDLLLASKPSQLPGFCWAGTDFKADFMLVDHVINPTIEKVSNNVYCKFNEVSIIRNKVRVEKIFDCCSWRVPVPKIEGWQIHVHRLMNGHRLLFLCEQVSSGVWHVIDKHLCRNNDLDLGICEDYVTCRYAGRSMLGS